MSNQEYFRTEGYKRGYQFCLYIERLYKALLLEKNNNHFHKGVMVAMRQFLADKEKEMNVVKEDRETILLRIKEDNNREKGNELER